MHHPKQKLQQITKKYRLGTTDNKIRLQVRKSSENYKELQRIAKKYRISIK